MSEQIIRFKDSEDKVVVVVPDGGVLRLFSGNEMCIRDRYKTECNMPYNQPDKKPRKSDDRER